MRNLRRSRESPGISLEFGSGNRIAPDLRGIIRFSQVRDAKVWGGVKDMWNAIVRLVRDDEGQDIIEYLLLGTFMALVVFTVLQGIGGNLNDWYETLQGKVEDATDAAKGAAGGGGGGDD